MIKGFKDFLLRGNVIDLAVAVVIGTAFANIVTAFTKSIVNPVIAAISNGKPGEGLGGFMLRSGNQATYVDLGSLVAAIINFLIVAAIVYFVFVAPVNVVMARRKRGEEAPVESTPEDIALLQEIRDLLAQQRGTPRA
jgi:large conductance mechanosensitive channel